jgi:hypothetical protein
MEKEWIMDGIDMSLVLAACTTKKIILCTDKIFTNESVTFYNMEHHCITAKV